MTLKDLTDQLERLNAHPDSEILIVDQNGREKPLTWVDFMNGVIAVGWV